MKKYHMFVPGLYESPEVRAVTPGHLVRCGHSSVYDVNFGKEAGAAAVILLNKGHSGVTVSGVRHGKIEYIKTTDAIKQRFVDLDMVSFYEQMGVSFGRKPQVTDLKLEEKKGMIERVMWFLSIK